MAASKRAPQRNVTLRRARRDLQHRRSERSFLWWFWGGWLGLLLATVANRSEHEQEALLEARHRRRQRRDADPTDRREEPQEAAAPIHDAPRAGDRGKRADLRRAAKRRHLIRTVIVVGGLTLLYLAFLLLRERMRR